jgi:hypothetical protein
MSRRGNRGNSVVDGGRHSGMVDGGRHSAADGGRHSGVVDGGRYSAAGSWLGNGTALRSGLLGYWLRLGGAVLRRSTIGTTRSEKFTCGDRFCRKLLPLGRGPADRVRRLSGTHVDG